MRTISPASARGSAENILLGKKAKTFSLKRGALTAFLLAFAVIFALFPERYVPVCLDGITIWALNVLPAVFPFLFVTALLRQTGGAEKVSRAFTPLSKTLFGTGGEGGFCFFRPFSRATRGGESSSGDEKGRLALPIGRRNPRLRLFHFRPPVHHRQRRRRGCSMTSARDLSFSRRTSSPFSSPPLRCVFSSPCGKRKTRRRPGKREGKRPPHPPSQIFPFPTACKAR